MKLHLQTLFDKITKNDLPFAKTLTNASLTVCMGHDYAIHIAIRNNHLDMVDVFLNINPALVNQLTGKGESPLMLAAQCNQKGICEYLLSKSADLNLAADCAGDYGHGYTALHWARCRDNEDMLKTLIAAGAVDTPFNGCYLIHWAVGRELIEIVKLLIDKNPALVNQPDNFGQTPLMLAVKTDANWFGRRSASSSRRLALTQYLVLEGAELSVVSGDGSTVLDFARNGSRAIEDFLITAITCEEEKRKEKMMPTAFSSSTMVLFPKQVTIKTEQANHTSAIDDPWNW